ncbi:uncharacterized protein DEA37_0010259 [Paragonimus westermani]|uniref:Glycosyltransferase-like protein LARGE n=1 Tax=Paragonimus westermani TaxID=34504 RepID=A0A5J4NYH4_9TREM|nr:uncharacterized protein DEA37_0010259 [Paragonimus westermani]
MTVPTLTTSIMILRIPANIVNAPLLTNLPRKLYIRRRSITVVLCSIFLVPLLFSLRQPARVSRLTRNFDMETVHVVYTLRGSESLVFAEVLLKSMLYYQGRFHEDNSTCTTNGFPQIKPRCPQTLPIRQSHIVIHVLIDYATRAEFARMFHLWQRPFLEWRFYRAEYHEKLLRQLKNSHHSGIPSLMKLLVPVILPDEVEKAIVMDSDMLFNHNVLELWELFEQFNSSQAIGLSWTLKAPLPGCQYFRYTPITVSCQ